MPVRKIGPKRGVNRRCLVARPNPDVPMVFCESLLERDFIRLCNMDSDVVDIQYQPLCLMYNHAGKRKKYYPDFLLTLKDDSRILVEVKTEEHVNDAENQVKYKVGEMYCQEQVWKFKVLTEEEINKGQLGRNVNKLLDVQRFQIDSGVLFDIYKVIKEEGASRISQIREEHFGDMDVAIYTAAVYKLLLHQLIITNLSSGPLSDESIIQINEKREWDEVFG